MVQYADYTFYPSYSDSPWYFNKATDGNGLVVSDRVCLAFESECTTNVNFIALQDNYW